MTGLSSRFTPRLLPDRSDDTVLLVGRISVWSSLVLLFVHSQSTRSGRVAIRRASTTWTRPHSTRAESSNHPHSHLKMSKPISKIRIIPVKSRSEEHTPALHSH